MFPQSTAALCSSAGLLYFPNFKACIVCELSWRTLQVTEGWTIWKHAATWGSYQQSYTCKGERSQGFICLLGSQQVYICTFQFFHRNTTSLSMFFVFWHPHCFELSSNRALEVKTFVWVISGYVKSEYSSPNESKYLGPNEWKCKPNFLIQVYPSYLILLIIYVSSWRHLSSHSKIFLFFFQPKDELWFSPSYTGALDTLLFILLYCIILYLLYCIVSFF